jgi:hypothetical protein
LLKIVREYAIERLEPGGKNEGPGI